MLDQIQQLEQRVEMLMRLLEKVRQDNERLTAKNAAQREEIETLTAERARAEQLQGQVRQLENEMEGVAGRESQIRDRLRVILGKIDSMEAEIGNAVAADD